MFGALFVDVVCCLDEVKVGDVYFFSKTRNSDMILLYKRVQNFLLIINFFFFKTSETFHFIVVRFQAPEMFDFIAFNVALHFFIALHLKSGVKTKEEGEQLYFSSCNLNFF